MQNLHQLQHETLTCKPNTKPNMQSSIIHMLITTLCWQVEGSHQ